MTRKEQFFFQKRTQSWSGEVTELWLRPFFFFEITKIWLEKPFQFRCRPFFWRSPDFDTKTASIWFKTDENLGQVRLLLFSPLKKARSPFAKSWLRAWHV